jgi:hypothetical protein
MDLLEVIKEASAEPSRVSSQKGDRVAGTKKETSNKTITAADPKKVTKGKEVAKKDEK